MLFTRDPHSGNLHSYIKSPNKSPVLHLILVVVPAFGLLGKDIGLPGRGRKLHVLVQVVVSAVQGLLLICRRSTLLLRRSCFRFLRLLRSALILWGRFLGRC